MFKMLKFDFISIKSTCFMWALEANDCLLIIKGYYTLPYYYDYT